MRSFPRKGTYKGTYGVHYKGTYGVHYKGTYGLHYKISSMRNRNVMVALKCMANSNFRALQLNDRYSDSQCVRHNV